MVTDTLISILNILLNPLTMAVVSVAVIGIATYVVKRRK